MQTKTKTGLEEKIREMAGRIRALREIVGLSTAEMAEKTDVEEAEYIACEAGRQDLNFAFLYRCAQALGVDVTDIIEGTGPRLSSYTVTRRGEGQKIEQAHGMIYYNLAAAFKNRIAEPLFVCSVYSEEAQHHDIELTTHIGQECDIIVSGTLKVQVGEHIEILRAGDSIYYDSATPHGMIATEGADCLFYAIVLNPAGEPIANLTHNGVREFTTLPPKFTPSRKWVWEDYIDVREGENGALESLSFKNTDTFHFAFDIVDRIGREQPGKLAMLHLDREHTERRFTFADLSRASNRAANYFRSLGIGRGDRVLLLLKRHYQFWIALLGLMKIGAVSIPAPCQLRAHDISYRLGAAGITAVVATADGDIAAEVDAAAAEAGVPLTRILVDGKRDGWRDFDGEYPLFTGKFERPADAPSGDSLMLMYFTSGTSGNPKIAAHDYRYPLGHFHTAKYWHCVNPDGLHLTVADTGWAKAAWGKIFGQWLCEAPIFVYDFDKFDAADILPMFAKYHITTFCAPPTILRMMVKEDISRYDLSSVEHMTTAGEALNPEVFRLFEAATGLQIMEGFGQSETTCVIANLVGTRARLGSMGKPVPLYRVALLDGDGRPVPDGEVGEICIDVSEGAPCGLFRGYYHDDEKTAECWHDGYYHTGDTAWRDEDGYYWYVGRTDDLIKSSGYRIGPFEIENVLMELPYILECGVSAAPDPVRGQVVKASIVLTRGTAPTEELKKEIQNYVKERTAPYKYPRIVVFREELPKTTSGKIQRNKL